MILIIRELEYVSYTIFIHFDLHFISLAVDSVSPARKRDTTIIRLAVR